MSSISPTLYATILSKEQLSLAEVCEYARKGRQHSILDVDSGLDFKMPKPISS
jgi:hypothetical protein